MNQAGPQCRPYPNEPLITQHSKTETMVKIPVLSKPLVMSFQLYLMFT